MSHEKRKELSLTPTGLLMEGPLEKIPILDVILDVLRAIAKFRNECANTCLEVKHRYLAWGGTAEVVHVLNQFFCLPTTSNVIPVPPHGWIIGQMLVSNVTQGLERPCVGLRIERRIARIK